MRTWLRRHGFDWRFLLWLLLLVLTYPLVLGVLTLLTAEVPAGRDPTRTVGYMLAGLLMMMPFVLAYLTMLGIPVAAAIWLITFAAGRRSGLSAQRTALLGALVSGLVIALPMALIWAGEAGLFSGLAAMFLAYACLLGLVYGRFAYRGSTWRDFT